MKVYDNSRPHKMKMHTIRATLQSGKFKGHIAYRKGGNIYGADVLKFNDLEQMFPEDVGRFVENDCKFRIIIGEAEDVCFKYVLKDEHGNTCEFEDFSEEDVSKNVVALEIINVDDYEL
ncbi:hypothetical protein HNP89_000950 [Methanococcus maripaludis]|uniref:Uncharacterized protein n=1 Tax=Methanococcus maripaludis TaxID=39152 RepID=A0A7J9P0Z5_METMI|nr:DUF5406 family protein [Methanococcus maripaludis]MBA2852993.1 hypothetical protein [Methanococcus maripaludis]